MNCHGIVDCSPRLSKGLISSPWPATFKSKSKAAPRLRPLRRGHQMRTLAFKTRLGRAALLGATMLSGFIAVEAHAQTAPTAQAPDNDVVEEIVVSGYRQSLAQS